MRISSIRVVGDCTNSVPYKEAGLSEEVVEMLSSETHEKRFVALQERVMVEITFVDGSSLDLCADYEYLFDYASIPVIFFWLIRHDHGILHDASLVHDVFFNHSYGGVYVAGDIMYQIMLYRINHLTVSSLKKRILRMKAKVIAFAVKTGVAKRLFRDVTPLDLYNRARSRVRLFRK